MDSITTPKLIVLLLMLMYSTRVDRFIYNILYYINTCAGQGQSSSPQLLTINFDEIAFLLIPSCMTSWGRIIINSVLLLQPACYTSEPWYYCWLHFIQLAQACMWSTVHVLFASCARFHVLSTQVYILLGVTLKLPQLASVRISFLTHTFIASLTQLSVKIIQNDHVHKQGCMHGFKTQKISPMHVVPTGISKLSSH